VEPFPDLSKLDDDELRRLIDDFKREENEISRQRRMLHGKIDMLRAELEARLQKKVGEGSYHVDIAKLSAILAGKSAPPDEAA
jgi:hypothetical protein